MSHPPALDTHIHDRPVTPGDDSQHRKVTVVETGCGGGELGMRINTSEMVQEPTRSNKHANEQR